MKAFKPNADDVLRQVLEIVDMFDEENRRMALDILYCNPNARRFTVSPPDANPNDTELDELDGQAANIHAATSRAAKMIGDAIRKRFGLPAKADQD
jgi:hypothetical protein